MFVTPSETELLMLMSKYCKQGLPYKERVKIQLSTKGLRLKQILGAAFEQPLIIKKY